MMTDPALIRNFSIIAHIDHGKSTLADRMLRAHPHHRRARHDGAGPRLDGHRARARHHHQGAGGPRAVRRRRRRRRTQLNLIDTPGHVDFTYEVSRSLAACEGVLLVVDAAQGVEAQTVANALMAMNAHLEIIPLINKIDLPAADPERVRHEIEEALAIPADEAVLDERQDRRGRPRGARGGRAPRPAAGGRCATRRSRRSSSTRTSTRTAASSRSSASSTARLARA